MRRTGIHLSLWLALLILPILACGPDLNIADVTVPPGAMETAEAAGEQAAEAAQTSAAEAGIAVQTAAVQAGDLVQTAAIVATQEGSVVVGTVQAAGTPGVNFLKEKLASAQTDENGNFSISIHDSELNRILQVAEFLANLGLPATFQNAQVTFTGGNISISASVTQPVSGRLVATFSPQVEDGRLTFDLVNASMGSVEVPATAVEGAESILNSSLGEAIGSLPDGLRLQQVVVEEGSLTLIGGQEASVSE
jgi:hypothetical protein